MHGISDLLGQRSDKVEIKFQTKTTFEKMNGLHFFKGAITTKSGSVPQPPRLILSGEKLSRVGIFLMDAGQVRNKTITRPLYKQENILQFTVWSYSV